MAILSLADFKSWVRTEISTDDTLNQAALDASLGLLRSESGRDFTVVDGSSVDVTRTFRPDRYSDVLRISDYATITSVTENGTLLVADTNYIAEPYGNRHPATSEWRPYDRLIRLDRCWYTNDYRRTISIVGKPGWSTQSAVLVEALKVLAADWLSMRDSRNGVVAVTTDNFSIGARTNPLVLKAITALKGQHAIGIAG